MRILALSIRQPWAWAILHAGKDIENRDWSTDRRGPILIHASKGCTIAEYDDACEFIYQACPHMFGPVEIPALKTLERGGIVGRIDIVDCVSESDSDWFVGEYGFVLRNPKPLPFVPMKGALGFFEVPLPIITELRRLKDERSLTP